MNLRSIQQDVIALTTEVASFIQHECENFDRAHIEEKGKFNNLVSYVDKEAEQRLVTVLRKLVPQAGFITEEGTVEQSRTTGQAGLPTGQAGNSHEYNWVIDPLDGTTNFLHGMPVYAISLALIKNNKPVLGVVHEVPHKECFHAIEHEPAYCNDKVIKVSAIHDLAESLLATGFPYYHFEKMEAYLTIIKDFLDKTHGIRRLGSAAIDLAYVACGRLDGFFEYNLNPWDVAAGAFIVQQAGGHVTDFGGKDNYLFGGELCCSNKHIHTEMLQIIQQYWN
jgi:myo-inositol-1(or 4)-monophosphatase